MDIGESATIWSGDAWSNYSREWSVETGSEIAGVLARRHDRGVNEFWLFYKGQEFPRMAINVAGDLAFVHYFPCDGHPGWRLLGHVAGLDPKGETAFQICGEYDTAPNVFVVPCRVALEVAIAFSNDTRMPEVGEWYEL
jgi:hypothetical protein